MKYFQVVCAMGFLLAATNSFAAPVPDLIVSGTNDPLVNGTYTYNGDFGSKASWAKGDYVLRWSPALMGYAWNIENPSSGSGEMYYWNWSDTPVPQELGWSCSHDYVLPCTQPVVTEDPLPETLIVSGTVDSFLNGEFDRGLNVNGYPRYIMGDYDIHAEGAMASWRIEHIVEGFQYYGNSVNGATVPEYGWYLGAHAGSPTSPSPPVVTAQDLPDRYHVRWAGSSEVNGVYSRVLNSLDGLVYEKEAIYHLEAGYYVLMAYGYGITKSGTGTFYSVEDESLLIPSSGWSVGAHGIANPPYVFPYTFPWQMYLPSVTGGEN